MDLSRHRDLQRSLGSRRRLDFLRRRDFLGRRDFPGPAGRISDRPAAAPSAAAGSSAAAGTSAAGTYVTVRGALVGLFALCLVTCLIATWRNFDLLAGLAYVAGSLAAPAAVRREAQLQVVIAPPVVFLLAVLVTQVLTAQGSSAHGSLLSVIEGTLLMLAATAPWLFAGATVCIAVAMFRGLPDCVRQFRAGFRAERKSGTWHRAASS